MSRYIATRAIRGANALVLEAEVMLQQALAEKGPETPVSFPNTAYYLPLIYAMTGTEVEKLGDLPPDARPRPRIAASRSRRANTGRPTWARRWTAAWPR